jgi:quinoprotein glucose dehydrogenase
VTPKDVNPYLLTREERANWKDRIASARSGLFTPPSLNVETIAMPGARGGANWGTTASIPEKGLVFISAQDWPSVYKLGADPPSFGGGRGGAGQDGPAIYSRTCQGCHGANRAGSTAFPSLVGITKRLGLPEFRQLVVTGKGEMPAFPNLDGVAVNTLFAHLANLDGTPLAGRGGLADPPRSFGGPVVASGGAPGGLDVQPGRFGGGMAGPAYPDDVEAPSSRYYTGYGLEFPYLISPPWSSLVAYDLNKGTIAWKVALGEDAQAASEGGKNTGMLAGVRASWDGGDVHRPDFHRDQGRQGSRLRSGQRPCVVDRGAARWIGRHPCDV